MTTVTLTSSELRHSKAILIAADAGQWLRPDRLIDGRRAVGIPSQTKRGLYHWTDGVTCSCYDFRRRQQACKHVIAHRLDAIARPQQPQPASATVDGLAQMAADKGKVLEMVREPEGDITWRALSDKYDDVFKRFDDDGPRSVRKEAYL
jgi:hypothetical protein